MNAEIIAVGTELLMGEITDTNSSFIAARLPALGLSLRWITLVGDDMEQLTQALRQALARSDYIFTMGGLGPTEDDLTREAIAQVLGEEMKVDPELLKGLEAYFVRRHVAMPPSNLKQASLIPSATALANSHGTAPGWWVERDGRVIVAFPGPPDELQRMWENEVAPQIRERARGEVILTRTLKTASLMEAAVNDAVKGLMGKENPFLGIYAKPDGIHLRIIAHAPNEDAARYLLAPVEAQIRDSLGPHIWGVDNETPEERAGALLRERGLTLATMESCTGGLLASAITDVPGSSDYYKGGIVAYSNELKVANGVDPGLIETHGAVSTQVAEAMALAAVQRLKADCGIGITGVAGPGEIESKPVGTVCISVTCRGKTHTAQHGLPPRRPLVKRRAVVVALLELCRVLRS